MSQSNRFDFLGNSKVLSKESKPKFSRGFPNSKTKKKQEVVFPSPIIKQRLLCKKHKYLYRVVSNGNVENNSTLYIKTGVAHPHQIETLLQDVIKRAEEMPEVFGSNFECDVQVNLVRKHTGQYMAYAFVDVSNPKLYYALIQAGFLLSQQNLRNPN